MNRKILITVSLIFLSSLSFSVVHATSGACSYHSGVNCSIGADYNGYAICNDGSSSGVLFSDMDECKTAPRCVVDQATWDLAKKGVDDVSNSLDAEFNQYQNSLNEIRSGSYSLTSSQQSLIDSTSQSFNQMAYQSQLRLAALSSQTGGVSNNSGVDPQIQGQKDLAISNLKERFAQENYEIVTNLYEVQKARAADVIKKLQDVLSCSIQRPDPVIEPKLISLPLKDTSIAKPAQNHDLPKLALVKKSVEKIPAKEVAPTSTILMSSTTSISSEKTSILSTTTNNSDVVTKKIDKKWYQRMFDYLFTYFK